MFGALITRRRRRGYEQLPDETAALELKLSRAKSLPAKFFSSSRKTKEEVKKASKVDPFFSIFETGQKKKATAKPEFARYLAYVKEGGIWDMGSNMPVIYYR